MTQPREGGMALIRRRRRRTLTATTLASRLAHDALLVCTGFLMLALAYELWIAATNPLGVLHYWGADYNVYMDATRRFLAGGSLYDPMQLLYPPIALLLLVPFVYLPAVLWWVIPLGVIAYVAWRQCRTDWQRVALLAVLALPSTMAPLVAGNGSLWVAAAIVAGNRWRWPAALVILKPTLAPWSLLGIRSRAWWAVAALLALLSLALLPLWPQWIAGIAAWHESPVWSTGGPVSSPGLDYLTAAAAPLFALLWFATRRAESERPFRPSRGSDDGGLVIMLPD